MAQELTGQRFGRLVVLGLAECPEHIKHKRKHWLCRCDCGNITIVSGGNIGRETVSCGCKRREPRAITHGCASHKNYNRLYHIWTGIKFRCYNSKSKDFPHYGGRGIVMCEEWLHDFPAFQSWALTHGYSEKLTIDRIDVNGNYEPNNCRWATVAEQNRNKTSTRKKVKNDTL